MKAKVLAALIMFMTAVFSMNAQKDAEAGLMYLTGGYGRIYDHSQVFFGAGLVATEIFRFEAQCTLNRGSLNGNIACMADLTRDVINPYAGVLVGWGHVEKMEEFTGVWTSIGYNAIEVGAVGGIQLNIWEKCAPFVEVRYNALPSEKVSSIGFQAGVRFCF